MKVKIQQVQVPSLEISTGCQIPVIGLGTFKSLPGEVFEAVKNAIDVGYRHIDGALLYANQTEVGAAIREKINEGIVERKDLFITDKLWNTFHSQDKVVPTLRQTLKVMGIDYVDLYLIHWPMGFQEGGEFVPLGEDGQVLYSNVDFVDTWRAMEECVKLGLAKNIGVSNFNHHQIERILSSGTIKPVMNQIECHPYLNQKKLIEYCKSKDILVTGYSPFGSPDRPWAKPTDPKILEDPRIVEIGEKYGKSPAQVILRWQIQRGIIVIPKTVTKERLIQNLSIFDFDLSTEDIRLLETFDCNGRVCHTTRNKHHKYYPFLAEF